jgi:hypothetical protein
MDLEKYMTEDEETEQKRDSLELRDTSNESILNVFDEYLKTPRFDGDACIVLTMPETTLKKYSEKINAGLWWMYNKYCKKDFGMMQLLVAIEKMVDATKLAAMLDMDIKLLLAKEAGIAASETDIEKAATRAEEDDESSIEPIKLSQDYVDKLTEDDPEEEAFILAGLQE